MEDSVANLDLPSVETLEDRGDPTLTSASLVALLPAEHLVAKKAFTPKAVDQGATANTWPRLMDAIKAIPICQQLIKIIRTGIPEELEDHKEPQPEKLKEGGDPTTKDGVAELEPKELEAPGDPEPEPEPKSEGPGHERHKEPGDHAITCSSPPSSPRLPLPGARLQSSLRWGPQPTNLDPYARSPTSRLPCRGLSNRTPTTSPHLRHASPPGT